MRKLRQKLLVYCTCGSCCPCIFLFILSVGPERMVPYFAEAAGFVFIQNQDDLGQGNNVGAGFDLKDRELFFHIHQLSRMVFYMVEKGNYEMKGVLSYCF